MPAPNLSRRIMGKLDKRVEKSKKKRGLNCVAGKFIEKPPHDICTPLGRDRDSTPEAPERNTPAQVVGR
jgi:hypothetical protein